MNPDELVNTSVHSQYKAEDGKLHEEERDVAKYWKKAGIEIALCGLENQTMVDANMPFRIIGYDGAAYRAQFPDKSKKVVPVVTFVLYFGTKERWNAKRTITHVDEVLKLLSVMTGDRKYESVLYSKEWKVSSMCEVAERLVNSGIAKRTEIGKAEGEAQLANLIKRLISEGRNGDIKLVVEDEEARKRFYREYGMID